MKTRIMIVVLFVATIQFIVLGFLFLLRLHYKFFGISFLVLGALMLFIAERYRRNADRQQPLSHSRETENHARL